MFRKMTWGRQLRTQLYLALVGLFVLVPVFWMISMAFDGTVDGSHLPHPTTFSLIPRLLSGNNISKVWDQPIIGFSFLHLLGNSLMVAFSTMLIALLFGTTAGYAFARFRFPGRRFGLLASLILITLPPAGLAGPYFLLLNEWGFRRSLLSLIMVYTAIALPFALWLVRNAVQAVPLEVEEAAMVEGAGRLRLFGQITLPLIIPSVAVAGFLGFVLAWSEFALGWAFISDPDQVTLAMALFNMRGQNGVAWGTFSAMALLVALPVVILFYLLGRYALNGFSLGAASIEA